MASGARGDHWLSDVLHHDAAVFGEPTDSLIREVDRLGGYQLLNDQADLGRRLSRLNRAQNDDLKAVTRELRRLRDSLSKEAIATGWDVE
ncbi:hypothetical protein AFL01nite_04980 [Aeromicrobium flavum]|uniref:Uncharacterized protein n=1 Tax=Aeromicrobium flavum TaxID=416568 RepID=A0A512HRU1_9ACTN|nr:hypothetical protein [Aeromicrobium flavum]GEO88171.1 hypothetical protein AFL01nite_04980 [Aeromicrobium flavum]